MFDMETGVLALEFCQRFRMVRGRVIEDGDRRTAQVPQQVAEEDARKLAPDSNLGDYSPDVHIQAQETALRSENLRNCSSRRLFSHQRGSVAGTLDPGTGLPERLRTLPIDTRHGNRKTGE